MSAKLIPASRARKTGITTGKLKQAA